jgi:hypothetical protein
MKAKRNKDDMKFTAIKKKHRIISLEDNPPHVSTAQLWALGTSMKLSVLFWL